MASTTWTRAPAPFALHLAWEPGVVRLDLIGELDITGVERLANCVDDIATMWPGATAVRVNLSHLSFVDLVGLRALAEACGRLQEVATSFLLEGLSDTVQHAMQVVGVWIPGAPARLHRVIS